MAIFVLFVLKHTTVPQSSADGDGQRCDGCDLSSFLLVLLYMILQLANLEKQIKHLYGSK
jgi:hypothetical protein